MTLNLPRMDDSHWSLHAPQHAEAARQLVGAGARGLMTYVPLPGDGKPHTVTLIPGDGIGPEVTDAVTEVVEALGAPIIWERCAEPSSRISPAACGHCCSLGSLATPDANPQYTSYIAAIPVQSAHKLNSA